MVKRKGINKYKKANLKIAIDIQNELLMFYYQLYINFFLS